MRPDPNYHACFGRGARSAAGTWGCGELRDGRWQVPCAVAVDQSGCRGCMIVHGDSLALSVRLLADPPGQYVPRLS
jgi:hypothetical protein